MSVVPYSTSSENRIILSFPTTNSLVLYNRSKNSLEVINNIGDNKPRSSSSHSSSDSSSSDHGRFKNGNPRKEDVECPSCGFLFSVEGSRRRGHNSSHRGGMTDSTSAYMDNDYFKLLQLNFLTTSNSPSNSHFTQKFIGNEESQYIRLSESLFTQGYFDKFFKILKKIGTGSNGSVYKVEHSLNGLNIGTFALKKIGIGEDLNNLANILKEVKFLYNLTNGDLYDSIVEDNFIDDEYLRDLLMAVDGGRHLIKYNHVWLEVDNASTFGPKIPCVFILFEYCDGGDLENFINKKFNITDLKLTKLELLLKKRGKKVKKHRKFLNNFEIFKIFKDICFGVYQLHKSHIIHRDLKPSNCLLKQTVNDDFVLSSIHELEKFPDIVVSDFGESAIEGTKRESSGYTGTLEFTSPELLFQNEEEEGLLNNFNKKTDVYSMGLILYFICFNKLPYKSASQDSIKQEIRNYRDTRDASVFLFDDELGRPVCESIDQDNFEDDALLVDFIQLIEMMCHADPLERPTVDQIIIFLVKDVWMKLESFSTVLPRGRRKSSVDTIQLQDSEDDEDDVKLIDIKRQLFVVVAISMSLITILLINGINWTYLSLFILGVMTKFLL